MFNPYNFTATSLCKVCSLKELWCGNQCVLTTLKWVCMYACDVLTCKLLAVESDLGEGSMLIPKWRGLLYRNLATPQMVLRAGNVLLAHSHHNLLEYSPAGYTDALFLRTIATSWRLYKVRAAVSPFPNYTDLAIAVNSTPMWRNVI